MGRMRSALVATGCASTLVVGCGGEDERSTRTRPRAKPTPSADLASRVVGAKKLAGFPLDPGWANEVRANPAALSADDPALYAGRPERVAAARRDGFVAGIARLFKTHARVGAAFSVAVQMRDERGALAEARREFDSFLAFCPAEAECDAPSRRFRVPGVPGALAAEVARNVDGSVVPELAINFTKGKFAYKVAVGAPGADKRRDELIAAATALYARLR